MNYKWLLGLVAASALTGCSIRQTVSPVQAGIIVGDLCVVDNARVRPGFMEAMRVSAKRRGVEFRVIPPNSKLTACEFTMTYTASWNWDMALYLRFAEIQVFHNGVEIGSAVYDSTRGGGRPDKWIDAEKKVDELVGQLFPPR